MRHTIQRHLSVLATAALLLGAFGCGQSAPPISQRSAISGQPSGVREQPSPDAGRRTPDAVLLGNLTVLLKWPEVRLLQTKVLPDSSTMVTITVSALDLASSIVYATNRAAGQTNVTATLTVPTGTNRSIKVEAKNGSILTASGSAAGITVGSGTNATVPIAMVATTVPSITSLSQANGGPGATVTITGTNFVPPGTTAPAPASANTTVWNVKFNGTVATVSAWSNTSITCTVPTGALTGNIVVTADSVPSASTANFQVLQTITVSPANPNVNAGSTQTFTASATDTTGATVSSPVVSWASSDTAVGTITSGGVLTGVMGGTTTVTAASGSIFGSTTAYVKPTITSLSPTSGAVGASLILNGNGYGATQGTSTVTVGGTAATVTSWANTAVTVTVPSLAAGAQNVVITVGGQASAASIFTVTPVISSLSPTTGPIGTAVTITGSNFGATQGTSTVTVGGVNATVTSWSATSIGITVPTVAAGGRAVVVTVNSAASNSSTFTVTPNITSISPGTVTVNDSFTITGNNFGATQGTSTVNWGTVTSWSDTSITLTVPSSTSPGGASTFVRVNGVDSNIVQITVRPNITSISPTSGPVGTTVTINGWFNDWAYGNWVKFNGTQATSVTWGSSQITVTVPSGATTGPVVVTIRGVDSNGVTFTVQ